MSNETARSNGQREERAVEAAPRNACLKSSVVDADVWKNSDVERDGMCMKVG